MSWGKKKKHASQNTMPAAEFRQEGESALFEKAPKEPPKPAPGEYLDNPLPVPKRHVRKEMNYAFEPSPDLMFYEIPVADNDDFDV